MSAALLKAIEIQGSRRNLARSIGVTPEVVNAWLNRGVRVPLEYAFEIERVTQGEVPWETAAPHLSHFAKRWSRWSQFFLKREVSVFQLLQVALPQIHHTCNIQTWTPTLQCLAEDIQRHGLQRPICVDAASRLIFGEKRLHAYERLGKKTIPAWRLSLVDMIEDCYLKETLRQTFVSSERVAIGVATEKFLKNRRESPIEQVPRQNFDGFKGRTDDFLADLFSFGNRQSYRHAKKICCGGCQALIEAFDHERLTLSAAAVIARLSIDHQERILRWNPREIMALVSHLRRHPALDFSILPIPVLEEV